MEYGDQLEDAVLCLDSPTGNIIFRDSPEAVADYRGLGRRLVEMGLRDQDAVGFIQQARKDFG
jgi:hypothetical protein